MKIIIKSFLGKITPLQVEPSILVQDLKSLLARTPGTGFKRQSASPRSESFPSQAIIYNGHELRDSRPLSFYHIEENSVLNIPIPTRVQALQLKFKKPDGTFCVLKTYPNTTVKDLKAELVVEEGVKVTQLNHPKFQQTFISDKMTVAEIIADTPDLVIEIEERPFTIILFDEDQDMSNVLVVNPTEPIGQLSRLYSPDPSLLRPEDVQYRFNDQTLDKSKTFMDYEIPDGGEVSLVGPTAFHILLHCQNKKLSVLVKKRDTLRQLREKTEAQHGISISKHFLIASSGELTGGESNLSDYGLFSGYSIYAVTAVRLNVVVRGNDYWLDNLHPLTRLSTIRSQVQGLVSARASSSSSRLPAAESVDKELDSLWFTLSDRTHLNESRRLFDLNIVSGMTIHMTPRVIPIVVVCRLGSSLHVDAGADWTIAQLRQHINLMVPSGKTGQLFFKSKLLQDHEELLKIGLKAHDSIHDWNHDSIHLRELLAPSIIFSSNSHSTDLDGAAAATRLESGGSRAHLRREQRKLLLESGMRLDSDEAQNSDDEGAFCLQEELDEETMMQQMILESLNLGQGGIHTEAGQEGGQSGEDEKTSAAGGRKKLLGKEMETSSDGEAEKPEGQGADSAEESDEEWYSS